MAAVLETDNLTEQKKADIQLFGKIALQSMHLAQKVECPLFFPAPGKTPLV